MLDTAIHDQCNDNSPSTCTKFIVGMLSSTNATFCQFMTDPMDFSQQKYRRFPKAALDCVVCRRQVARLPVIRAEGKWVSRAVNE